MVTFDLSPSARALAALSALAVGDAFGSRLADPDHGGSIPDRIPPWGPWRWSDDTEMAASVHAEVVRGQGVDPDRLAASFVRRHDSGRGYGAGTERLFREAAGGRELREAAARAFDGAGSWGNGAAMRVAPLGAYFADDLERVVEQARVSARVTHTHPEAVEGAVAVAVAAALMARHEWWGPGRFLDRVAEALEPGPVCEGVRDARALLVSSDPLGAATELGSGASARAVDTVPFALWVVARYRGGLESALWATVAPGGDMDTTCAIVAGVLGAGSSGAPASREWSSRVEALPSWALAGEGVGL